MISKDFCPDINQHIELMRNIVVEVRREVLGKIDNPVVQQFVSDHFSSLMVHWHEMLNRVAGDVLAQVQAQQPRIDDSRQLVGLDAWNPERHAANAYEMADAMLKARQQ